MGEREIARSMCEAVEGLARYFARVGESGVGDSAPAA